MYILAFQNKLSKKDKKKKGVKRKKQNILLFENHFYMDQKHSMFL